MSNRPKKKMKTKKLLFRLPKRIKKKKNKKNQKLRKKRLKSKKERHITQLNMFKAQIILNK
jgi:hypothetical protein